MKILIALLLTWSTALFAKAPVFPTLINFGNSVQVQVFNHTRNNILCSGTVYLRTLHGQQSRFYHEYIFAGMSSFRTFWPMRAGEPVLSTYHSIFCRVTR